MSRERLPIGGHGTIFTTRNKNGAWAAYAYYRGLDGQRKRLRATRPTKGKAEAALRERLATATRLGVGALTPASPLTEAIQAWAEETQGKGLATQTMDRYRHLTARTLTPLLGHLQIQEATPGVMHALLNQLHATTPSNARLAKTMLTQVFTMLIRMGVVTTNPMGAVRLPVTEVKHKRALEPEQVPLLLARLDGICRLAALIMLSTGARPGEVLALRTPEDLEPADGGGMVVHLRGTTVGSGTRVFRQEQRKNKKVLSVRVPATVAAAITAQAEQVGEGLLFPHWVPGREAISSTELARIWRQQVAGTEFVGVTPHAMRTTVATFLAREKNLDAAAEVLGHSSAAVTAQFYVQPRKIVQGVAHLVAESPQINVSS